jgi:hypothetical protein
MNGFRTQYLGKEISLLQYYEWISNDFSSRHVNTQLTPHAHVGNITTENVNLDRPRHLHKVDANYHCCAPNIPENVNNYANDVHFLLIDAVSSSGSSSNDAMGMR